MIITQDPDPIMHNNATKTNGNNQSKGINKSSTLITDLKKLSHT